MRSGISVLLVDLQDVQSYRRICRELKRGKVFWECRFKKLAHCFHLWRKQLKFFFLLFIKYYSMCYLILFNVKAVELWRRTFFLFLEREPVLFPVDSPGLYSALRTRVQLASAVEANEHRLKKVFIRHSRSKPWESVIPVIPEPD